MLIYSMSVSVDGFIADREGAFGWTIPSDELFRFHLAQVRELGGYLLGLGLTPPPESSRPCGQRTGSHRRSRRRGQQLRSTVASREKQECSVKPLLSMQSGGRGKPPSVDSEPEFVDSSQRFR